MPEENRIVTPPKTKLALTDADKKRRIGPGSEVVRAGLAALIALAIALPATVAAHPGGLDANGGHTVRKTGEYHLHAIKPGADLPAQDAMPVTPLPGAAESKSRLQKAQLQQRQYQEEIEYQGDNAPGKYGTISGPEREKRINEYFRSANSDVGALDCQQRRHERSVDEKIKREVRHRDGNRCVICGSRNKLEVDHRRALMNGGTNDESNLATLCDDCHTIKTKMDSSLRRKREKVCR